MTEAEQNLLIIEHMDSLVPAIAVDYRGREVEFDELMAAGREGLIKAARTFEEDKSQFTTWATTKIKSAIMDEIERAQAQWYPKETDAGPLPARADSIEKIFDWDSWGKFGNAVAICETWSNLDASPEELSILYSDIQDKQAKFDAAFISLTVAQRKLVTWVYLRDPAMPITQAARDLGVSYFKATRMLQKALKTMGDVISRMEANTIGRPSLDAIPSPGARAVANKRSQLAV